MGTASILGHDSFEDLASLNPSILIESSPRIPLRPRAMVEKLDEFCNDSNSPSSLRINNNVISS